MRRVTRWRGSVLRLGGRIGVCCVRCPRSHELRDAGAHYSSVWSKAGALGVLVVRGVKVALVLRRTRARCCVQGHVPRAACRLVHMSVGPRLVAMVLGRMLVVVVVVALGQELILGRHFLRPLFLPRTGVRGIRLHNKSTRRSTRRAGCRHTWSRSLGFKSFVRRTVTVKMHKRRQVPQSLLRRHAPLLHHHRGWLPRGVLMVLLASLVLQALAVGTGTPTTTHCPPRARRRTCRHHRMVTGHVRRSVRPAARWHGCLGRSSGSVVMVRAWWWCRVIRLAPAVYHALKHVGR